MLDGPRGHPRGSGPGAVDRPLRAGLELVGPHRPQRAQPLNHLAQTEQRLTEPLPITWWWITPPVTSVLRQPLHLPLECLHLAKHGHEDPFPRAAGTLEARRGGDSEPGPHHIRGDIAPT